MKKLFLFLITLISLTGYSQEELIIDYLQIKTKVSNPDLVTYYPKLLKRYNEFDATLTLEEKALIYYGFSFQEDYMKNKPQEEQLLSLIEAGNFQDVADECQKILLRNPISLKANYEMGYALYKLGKPESEWKKYQNRYRDFRKIIAYSGNGLSCETAFKVIHLDDEYDMIYSYFEILKTGRQSLEQLCDKFEVQPSDYYKVNIMYFDASRILNRRQEILDSKGK